MSEPTTSILPGMDLPQVVREHIAYHEAGHALVAALLGQYIEWVALAPAQGLVDGGRCVSRGPMPDTREGMIAHLSLFCAGLMAETLSPHQETLQEACFDRRDDEDAFQQELATYGPDTSADARRQIRQEAYRYARSLLERPCHAEAVRVIAAALVQYGTLGHHEVLALLTQARAHEEAVQRVQWSRAWRWFWVSSGLLLVGDLALSAALRSVVNGWLLLACSAVASALLPLFAWKLTLRRSAAAAPGRLSPRETPLASAGSCEGAGVGGGEHTSLASSPARDHARKQPPPRKRGRGAYERHRRLPERQTRGR